MGYLIAYVVYSWLICVMMPGAICQLVNAPRWERLNGWWFHNLILGPPRFVTGQLHKALGGGAKKKKFHH